MTTIEAKPFSTVVSKIRELAKQSPDRTESCSYFDSKGAPKCIVGNALADLGVKPMNEPLGYGVVNGYCCGDMLTEDGAFFAEPCEFAETLPWELAGVESPTPEQITWVHRVQVEQDNGVSWGMAVATAEKLIGAVA